MRLLHFNAQSKIPSAPTTVVQLSSFHHLSRVEPQDLTVSLKSHLQTLYAQSFWITLASYILLQLLAQSQSMLIPQILSLLLLHEKKLTTSRPFTSTQHCSVRLLSIVKNFSNHLNQLTFKTFSPKLLVLQSIISLLIFFCLKLLHCFSMQTKKG